jgi:hypothetical protein
MDRHEVMARRVVVFCAVGGVAYVVAHAWREAARSTREIDQRGRFGLNLAGHDK